MRHTVNVAYDLGSEAVARDSGETVGRALAPLVVISWTETGDGRKQQLQVLAAHQFFGWGWVATQPCEDLP